MVRQLLSYKTLLKASFWLWLLLIVIVSSLPNVPTQEINLWDEPFRLDYLEHFGVFAILQGIFVLWKADENGFFHLRNHLIFVGGLILFAVIDELHQLWIPGRSYNSLDLMYNLIGSFAGIFVTKYGLKRVITSFKN
ncbi:MAG: VanZ family protein [Bacteroidales bacterium]|nr:VanZ family protein [Bacteroidales bacterium]